MSRIVAVACWSGAFVVFFAGAAFAADRVLDQTTCEDNATWGNSSLLSNGSWNSATNTCTVDFFRIRSGDQLVIPSGTTLANSPLSHNFVEGSVINNGTVSLVAAQFSIRNSGSFVNNGTFSTSLGIFIFDSGSIVNNSFVDAESVNLQSGGVFDNYGSVTLHQLYINESGSGGAVFTNYCGSDFTADIFVGDLPVFETCSEPTTTTSTTIPTSSTTIGNTTTTLTGPTTTAEVSPISQTLPLTGSDNPHSTALFAMLLISVGLLALIFSASRTRQDVE